MGLRPGKTKGPWVGPNMPPIPPDLDEKVKATNADTTTEYLNDKIVAGTGISTAVVNKGGGNLAVQISAPGSTTDEKVKVDSQDTTPGYLDPKFLEDASMLGGPDMLVAGDKKFLLQKKSGIDCVSGFSNFTPVPGRTAHPYWYCQQMIKSGQWQYAFGDRFRCLAPILPYTAYREGMVGENFDHVVKMATPVNSIAGIRIVGANGNWVQIVDDHSVGTGVFIRATSSAGLSMQVAPTGALANLLRIWRASEIIYFAYYCPPTDNSPDYMIAPGWNFLTSVTVPMLTDPMRAELLTSENAQLLGGWFQDSVVDGLSQPLVEASPIVVDSRIADVYTVTLTANRTMSAPLSAHDGQQITFAITQDGTGGWATTWNAAFRFQTMAPTPSLAPGSTDYYRFIYNAATATWDYVDAVSGAPLGELVKVTAADTTAGYLETKLTGLGQTFETLNPAGSEVLENRNLPAFNDPFYVSAPFWPDTEMVRSGDFSVDTVNHRINGIAENNVKDWYRIGIEGDFDYIWKLDLQSASSCGMWFDGNSLSTSMKLVAASNQIEIAMTGETTVTVAYAPDIIWFRVRRDGRRIRYYHRAGDTDSWILDATFTKDLGYDVKASLDSMNTGRALAVWLHDNVISQRVRNVQDKVVPLTDGATINIDLRQGNVYEVVLGGNRTLAAPTANQEPRGTKFILRIRQDATGTRLLTWNAAYRFPGGTAPTLTTAAGKTDYFGFVYNERDSVYDCIAQEFNL